jgi:hypothetical protein
MVTPYDCPLFCIANSSLPMTKGVLAMIGVKAQLKKVFALTLKKGLFVIGLRK